MNALHQQRAKFHLSSTIIGKVNIFDYVVYFSADTHYQQCASVGKWITWPNKLSLVVIVIRRWNLAQLTVEGLVNTVVLVLWRYLRHSLRRTRFSLEQDQLIRIWSYCGYVCRTTKRQIINCVKQIFSQKDVRKQNASCVANILDMSTKQIPLCSPSSPPSSGPNSIFLATLLLKLAHLAILFILQLTHTSGNVYEPKNK